MKKILLLALCAFCGGTAAMAQATITGTVTDNNALPVASHVVYASDTFGQTWTDSALTDASGNYTITIPNSVPNGGMLVSTNET